MSLLLITVSIILYHISTTTHTHAQSNQEFTFHGFRSTNLTLDGVAEINTDGIVFLTSLKQQISGSVFNPSPMIFKKSTNDSAISFSTSFVFGIKPEITIGGHGICFVIAPQLDLSGALSDKSIGLFNMSPLNQNGHNHIIAVEFDTVQSSEFEDIDNNHVGIDIDSLKSITTNTAGYYLDNNCSFQRLALISNESRRVWIEYDGVKKQMNVTLAPINMAKPSKPLLSLDRDLSQYIKPIMYVGFTAATGAHFNRHYLLGWSFKLNGQAKELDISMLPNLSEYNNTSPTTVPSMPGPIPQPPSKFAKTKMFLKTGLPSILGFVVIIITLISYCQDY